MYCPYCLNETTKILATVRKDESTERFRICPTCKYTFVTVEFEKTDNCWVKYAKTCNNQELLKDINEC